MSSNGYDTPFVRVMGEAMLWHIGGGMQLHSRSASGLRLKCVNHGNPNDADFKQAD